MLSDADEFQNFLEVERNYCSTEGSTSDLSIGTRVRHIKEIEFYTQ